MVVPTVVTYCQSSFALSLTYQAMGRAKDASQIIESVIGYMLETGNADLLELCQVFRPIWRCARGMLPKLISGPGIPPPYHWHPHIGFIPPN